MVVLDPSGAIQVDAEHPAVIGRLDRPVPLDDIIVAAIERQGPFRSRLLPGRGTWNGAGPADATHQAADQGCCGVEVRGFEPLASSVRASWG